MLGWGDSGELSLAGEDRADLKTLCLQGRKVLQKPRAAKSKLKKQPTTNNKKNPTKNPSPAISVWLITDF